MWFDCETHRGCPFFRVKKKQETPRPESCGSALPAVIFFHFQEAGGGAQGSVHLGPSPWCPRASPRRGGSRKEGGGNIPRFPAGCAHLALPDPFRNETRAERSDTEAWDLERARPKTPVSGRGEPRRESPPYPPLQPAGLWLCPPSGSAASVGIKKKTNFPLCPISSPPAAPSSSTWLAQVFHVNDSNKYLIMSRSYRRFAEQPALMRHPGEVGERREEKELKGRKKVFSALLKAMSKARPDSRGMLGIRGWRGAPHFVRSDRTCGSSSGSKPIPSN